MQILSVRAQAPSEPVGSEPTSSWFSFLLQPHWPQVFGGYAIRTGPLFSLPPSAPDMSTAPGHELVAGAQTGATGILHAIFGITHPSLSFPGGNVVSFPTARPRKILGATGAWLLPPPPPLYPVEPRLTVPRLRHGRLEGQGDFGAKGIRPLHGAHDSMKVPPCERKL